jgi:hypothetical protein
MAQPVMVQNSGVSTGNGTSLQDATGFTVTAGNILLVQLTITADPRTITLSDDQGNTGWTQIVSQASSVMGAQSEIWACFAPAAGATKVTVSVSGAAVDIAFVPSEWQYADAADASSSFDNTSASTTQFSAASGAIDTTTDVAVLFVTQSQFTQTVNVFASGFTRVGSGATKHIFGYRSSAGALTDERASYTVTVARSSAACIASFKDTPSAGGGPFPHHVRRQLIGGMSPMKGAGI